MAFQNQEPHVGGLAYAIEHRNPEWMDMYQHLLEVGQVSADEMKAAAAAMIAPVAVENSVEISGSQFASF